MATKLKDYYNLQYCQSLADKLQTAYRDFDHQRFLALIEPALDQLEFNDRQILIAKALKACLPEDYVKALAVFYKILGPELPGSLGMFTEGWWLWPIGKYVELFGGWFFEESTALAKS